MNVPVALTEQFAEVFAVFEAKAEIWVDTDCGS